MITGLKKGMVSLVKYSPVWKDSFVTERNELLKLIGNLVVEIHHVGSTSIQHIYAKPIIDILVVLNSEKHVQEAKLVLENKGYILSSFKPRGHFLFKKEKDDISTHYIHLVKIDDDWQRYILFRDYLINNLKVADEHQKLKRTLAEQYSNNRIQYTAMKSNFIEEIITKARKIKW